MSNIPLIVCEKSGRWAVALRSALGGSSIRIAETRALGQCEAALRAAPASLVALEVAGDKLPQAIDFALRAGRDFPAARLVALLSAGLDSEPLLREAGVTDIFHSPLQASAIACLAQRHVAATPPVDRPLRESIAARLPWDAWATPGFAASLSPPQE